MIVSRKFGIAYFPTPKNACSSIKNLMFYITNQFYFRPYMIDEKYYSIHDIHESYRTKKFESVANHFKDYQFRFCVVREPIQRLRSAYYNKVVQHKHLVGTRFEDKVRSFDDFLVHLEPLMNKEKLFLHHCRPQTYFLGERPGRYSKIYNLTQLGSLVDDLSEITGMQLELRKVNRSSSEYSEVDDQYAIQKHAERLKKLFKKDYNAYGDYF